VATVEFRDVCLRRELHRGSLPGTGEHGLFSVAGSGVSAPKSRQAFTMENLSFTVPNGQTMVVLGPSGCGKTTLLRVAAGLQSIDSGQVLFDGLDIREVPPVERGIGMVFQGYALYPFTARRNILSHFLFRKRTPQLDEIAREKYRRTCELLGVDIEYLADRDTRNLSGGEKQRVALGRCITRDPRLFLLDEPFSNLDAQLREKYRFGLKKLLRELEITTIYVTHDQQEALILADLLAVMNVGTIEQVGTPERIYSLPNSLFVAEFLNVSVDAPAVNLIDGASMSSRWEGRTLGLRPEDVELSVNHAPPAWPMTVTSAHSTPMNRSVVLTARFRGQEVYLRLPAERSVEAGETIWLEIRRLHVFDSQSGQRIDTIRP
jgi:multiple sugar transport system ATP-binding protein